MSKQGIIGVEIVNLDEIFALVDELQNVDKNKSIKAGLRKAGRVFVSGGKRRLRERLIPGRTRTGNLMRSFTVRVKRHKLGALAGFKQAKFRGDVTAGNHAHLVDRGTVERYTKDGRYRGVMPANYFWDDTYMIDSGQALNELKKGIMEAVNKLQNG